MNELLLCAHVGVLIACGLFFFSRGYAALTAWICLQGVLANLFVLKEICFFGWHVTCSDALAIGMIFCLNLVREYFGKKKSIHALWTGFATMTLFVILAKIHLLYEPSPYDDAHAIYDKLLSPSPRLLAASLVAFFAAQKLDLALFQWIKLLWPTGPFSVRNLLSTVPSQFVDTALFSLLGLWGLVSHLGHIILVSFALKILLMALMTPLTLFSKRFAPLGSHERI